MIRTTNLVQNQFSQNHTRRRAASSASRSSSSTVPRTPIDAYFESGNAQLGNQFSVLKLQNHSTHPYQESSHPCTGYMRPQTISPVPPWLVNTLSGLDADHPLRVLVPKGTRQPVDVHSSVQSLPSEPLRPMEEQEAVFAFLPPSECQPCLPSIPVDQSFFTSNAQITMQSPSMTQHQPLVPALLSPIPLENHMIDNSPRITPTLPPTHMMREAAPVPEKLAGDTGSLQTAPPGEHIPFSRPGPRYTEPSISTHYPREHSPQLGFAQLPLSQSTSSASCDFIEPLSSSPGRNSQPSPITPSNESGVDWRSLSNSPVVVPSLGTSIHSTPFITRTIPYRVRFESPLDCLLETPSHSGSQQNPGYELALDYGTLDFKWEKFSRGGSLEVGIQSPAAHAVEDDSLELPEDSKCINSEGSIEDHNSALTHRGLIAFPLNSGLPNSRMPATPTKDHLGPSTQFTQQLLVPDSHPKPFTPDIQREFHALQPMVSDTTSRPLSAQEPNVHQQVPETCSRDIHPANLKAFIQQVGFLRALPRD